MNRLLPLVLFLFLSGCLSSGSEWERVDVTAFDEAIAGENDGFLLDVRTTSEWEQDGYLKNATLIPHTELESREGELPEEKDALILLYCRSGNRSQDAAQTLLDMGFTNLIELKSGITGWKDAGMPVMYDWGGCVFKFLARIFGTKGPTTGELLREGAIVVDVRSPREYQSGHVEGSRNIPLQSISAKTASLKKQKKVIITCCASGMRSGKAAKLLRQAGLEAHNGGAWQSVERARQG